MAQVGSHEKILALHFWRPTSMSETNSIFGDTPNEHRNPVGAKDSCPASANRLTVLGCRATLFLTIHANTSFCLSCLPAWRRFGEAWFPELWRVTFRGLKTSREVTSARHWIVFDIFVLYSAPFRFHQGHSAALIEPHWARLRPATWYPGMLSNECTACSVRKLSWRMHWILV